MTWCPHCVKNSQTHRDHTTGSVCCVDCGKVISHDIYTEDATFVKDASGATYLSGNLVQMGSACSESHRRTLNKGNEVIDELIRKYGIQNVDHAKKYYEIAVERGFTKGRRRTQVAAACLYVACRELEKPFLLIEFSSEMGASVYELGTVYLQLCKLLSLQDHPFIQKAVDPSLFMHRYTSGLVEGNVSKKVLHTALHLVVSMKKDWIQTGRKPSGICAAAIYVSCILHGYNISKTDVVRAVHICEATLTKRLIEFENTDAGGLTIEKFTDKAMEFEKDMRSCKQSASDLKMPGMTEVVCEHKNSLVQSGFGLCRNCYLEFCGGLDGSEPPAFQRAEMERLSKESEESLAESTAGVKSCEKTTDNEIDDTVDTFESSKDPPDTIDETDTLSQLDDNEINPYLNDKEEVRLKKIAWECINKEYIEEQAAKEAARKLYTGTSEEIEAQAHAARKKEQNKNKRELEAKNAKPAKTAAEATSQFFKKKKLSSKINYDVLNELFDTEPSQDRVNDEEQESGKGHTENNDMEYNDDETEDYEWNVDNIHEMNGYGDDYDGYVGEY